MFGTVSLLLEVTVFHNGVPDASPGGSASDPSFLLAGTLGRSRRC